MLREYSIGIPDAIFILLITTFWVATLWHTLNKITPFNDGEEFSKGNVAYAIQRGGIVTGQIIAMIAAISAYSTDNQLFSVGKLFASGAWTFVAFILSKYIVDWMVLPKVKNIDLLLSGNVSVGIVEAGSYIGLGFIMAGSLTGTGPSGLMTAITTPVFYALGVLFVLGVFWLHEWFTPYAVRERIKGGHVPTAIETASILVAVSIVVAVGVAGDFTKWAEDLWAFLLTSFISVLMMYPSWYLLSKMGPGRKLQQEPGLATVVVRSTFLVMMAFVSAHVVNTVI